MPRLGPLTTLADLEALLADTTNYEEKMPRDLAREIDLERTRALLAAVGDPQVGPTTFHVAGSKGKGSVARMVDAAWREMGREAGRGPVGLYTSPHLERLTERVVVDGVEVDGNALARAANALVPHLEATRGSPRFPTFFEILTAAAHVAFRERGVRAAVLEVGLGGRLDATNVCRPAATAVTAIELEHARLLGGTLESIAREKAGILKRGVPAVSGVTRGTSPAKVVEDVAKDVGAPLVRLGDEVRVEAASTGPGPTTRVVVEGPHGAPPLEVSLPVAGLHQAHNASVAVAACRLLSLDDAAIVRGLAAVTLPARLEVVLARPTVVIDGAHTPASSAAAAAGIAACFPHERLHLVLGVLEEKDVSGILLPLVPRAATVVACGVPSPRGLAPERLANAVRALGRAPVEVARDAAAGLALALSRAGAGDLVLVTGSLYLAGAARTAARAIPGFLPRDVAPATTARPPTT